MAFARLIPVGSPTKIGRVDVGSEPFLKTVELIGAHEVHFAREDGQVAELAKMVGKGRHFGWQLGGIVKAAEARWQAAREKPIAGRSTEWCGAICRIEGHASICEPGDIGSVDDLIAIRRQCRCIHLVCHKKYDVG